MTRVKLIDSAKPHWASRRFTMDGVEYKQNEKVDLTKLEERIVKRLIKFRYVTSIAPKGEAAVPVAADPNELAGKLKSVGGGQYEVHDANGTNLLPARVKGKDMARMAAEQMGIKIVE